MATSWVYFIQGDAGGLIKIGRSTDVQARVTQLQTASSTLLRVLFVIEETGNVREHSVHLLLDKHRAHGEWFHPHADVTALIDALAAGRTDMLWAKTRRRAGLPMRAMSPTARRTKERQIQPVLARLRALRQALPPAPTTDERSHAELEVMTHVLTTLVDETDPDDFQFIEWANRVRAGAADRGQAFVLRCYVSATWQGDMVIAGNPLGLADILNGTPGAVRFIKSVADIARDPDAEPWSHAWLVQTAAFADGLISAPPRKKAA